MARPVAYVIGATGALGGALSRTFFQAGFNLALGARSVDDLRALADSMGGSSSGLPDSTAPGRGLLPGGAGDRPRVEVCPLDSADPTQVGLALDAWESALGPPDACLHIAGGYAGGRSADACPPEEWKRMLDLNLLGPALVLSSAFGRMRRAGRGGSLLAVGAIGGIDPAPNKAPYGASKAGLLHLIRTLAEEGRPLSIRANAIVPTTLDTPQNRSSMPGADPTRWTSVDTAARVLLWLASEDARTVTGSFVRV